MFPLLMPLVTKPAELSAVGKYLQVAAGNSNFLNTAAAKHCCSSTILTDSSVS